MPASAIMRAVRGLLLAAGLLLALPRGLCASEAGAPEPMIGHWQVTSIVAHDGTTITPVDMFVTFSASGIMTVTLSTLGSTTSQFKVLRHERYSTILLISTNGQSSQASVEYDHKTMSLLSKGTTMFLSPVAPAIAAKPPPPPPPPTPYQLHGLEKVHPGPVAGTMEGVSWTLVAIQPNLLQDEGGWRVNLLGEKLTDEIAMSVGQLLVLVPKKLGRRDFDNGFNVTFFMPPSANIACGNGYIEVTAISDQLVTGSINAWLNDVNHVNGTFSFDPRLIPAP